MVSGRFVVPLDESRRRAMPARLIVHVSLALARAVGAVDFARRREDQKRVAVVVQVGIVFNLASRFGNRHLPAQGTRLVERLLDNLAHRLLVEVHHLVVSFRGCLTDKKHITLA